MLAITARDAVTDIEVVVPCGRTLLCCSPKFDYHDYLHLMDQYASNAMFTILPVTLTPQGRAVNCLRVGVQFFDALFRSLVRA